MFFSGFGSSGRSNKFNDNSSSNSNGNSGQTPWGDLQNATEMDRRALIEMACEYDRVDILQSVLQTTAAAPNNHGTDEDEESEEESLVLHSPHIGSSSTSRTFDLKLLNSPPKELLDIINCTVTDRISKPTDPDQVVLAKKDTTALVVSNASSDPEDSSYYSDEESSYDRHSSEEEDYEEEEEEEEEQHGTYLQQQHQQQQLQHQCFVPPLHIAVASGSTHATTALLRMGADPSVQPIFPQHVTGGPMAKFQRCRGGAYELLSSSSSSPLTNKLLSKTVVDQLKHAFTAEALRAIGSDEVHRLQQLLVSGMPPTEKVGDLTLYQWAVELKAIQCQQLLLSQQQQQPQGTNNITNISSTAATNTSTTAVEQQQPHSMSEHNNSTVASGTQEDVRIGVISQEDKVSSKSTIRKEEQQQESIKSLQIQIEEQQNLLVTLSSCLDRFEEESSIYEAILSTETKKFSKEGLLNKVKQLKASKAQLVSELEFYEALWKEAQENLLNLEEEILSEHNTIHKKDYLDNIATTPIEHAIEHSNTVSPEDLAMQLSICQEKVCKVRNSIADLAEENARKQTEIDELGLGGTIQLAKHLLEELFEVEYAVSQAKEGEAYCRDRIEKLLQQQHPNVDASRDDSIPNPSVTEVEEEKENVNTPSPFVGDEDKGAPSCSGEINEADDSGNNNLVMEYDLPPEELFDKLAGKEKVISLVDLLTRWVELREMLDDEDVYHDELQEIYSRIPKAHGDDKIDRTGFIALYRGIEDLFEDCATDDVLQPAGEAKQTGVDNEVQQQDSKEISIGSITSNERDSSMQNAAIIPKRAPRVNVDLWELLRRMVGLGRKVSMQSKLEYRDKGRKVIII